MPSVPPSHSWLFPPQAHVTVRFANGYTLELCGTFENGVEIHREQQAIHGIVVSLHQYASFGRFILEPNNPNALVIRCEGESPMNKQQISDLRRAFRQGAMWGRDNPFRSLQSFEIAADQQARRQYPLTERQRRVVKVDSWYYTVKDGALYFASVDWGDHFKDAVSDGGWVPADNPRGHVSFINGELRAAKPVLHHLGPIAALIQNPTEEVEA